MTLRRAFRLGLLPPLAGIRFGGDELLRRLPPSGAALVPAVGSLAARLSARAPEATAAVIECERIMVAAGRNPPARPHDAAEYRAWVKSVAATGRALYDKRIGEVGAFTVGVSLGDLLLTLELEEQVADLRRVAPAQPFLERAASALADDRDRAHATLVTATRSPGLPPATGPVLARMAAADLSELLELSSDFETALAPLVPFPDSICHGCAAPPKYVKTETSTFILCPLLPIKYPRQPVLTCPSFRAKP